VYSNFSSGIKLSHDVLDIFHTLYSTIEFILFQLNISEIRELLISVSRCKSAIREGDKLALSNHGWSSESASTSNPNNF
jgi:hypothetical protein